jgi:hypothetical protein
MRFVARSAVALLIVTGFLAPSGSVAQEFNTVFAPVGVTHADAVRLIEEYRVDEIREWVSENSGAFIFAYGNRHLEIGRHAEAFVYYRGYLRLFPFGKMSWDENYQQEWAMVAEAYVAAAVVSDEIDATEIDWIEIETAKLEQSRDALPIYRQLREAYAKRDAETYSRLTDEILAKYPRSIFAAAAVMTTAYGRGVCRHGGVLENDVKGLAKYLDRMAAAGIPEEERLPVMLMRQERAAHRRATFGDGEPPIEEVDVVRLSKNPLVRRAYLRERLKAALSGDDMPLARRIAQDYLAEHGGKYAPIARQTVIFDFLDADKVEETSRQVDAWRVSGIDVCEIQDAELWIADHCATKNEWSAALEHYRTIAEGKLANRTASARLGMARVYQQQGLEQKMIECLKAVAEAEEVDNYSRNRANGLLAEYYFQKEQWKESLAWYQKWEPWMGGCATGAADLEASREKTIATCQEKIRQAGR